MLFVAGFFKASCFTLCFAAPDVLIVLIASIFLFSSYLGHLPESLGRLTMLQHLNLFHNEFNGM